MEQDRLTNDNRELEHRLETKVEEIKKLATQLRDCRSECSLLSEKSITLQHDNEILKKSLHIYQNQI